MAGSIIDLIGLLDGNKSATASFPANGAGPIRPLYSVDFDRLVAYPQTFPKPIARLISTISQSASPYDKSVNKNSRSDETLGAMRQIHSNQNPSWLPRIVALTAKQKSGGGGSRAQAYDSYAQKYKQQTNDNGGSNTSTGYIEYTASELDMFTPEPEKRARIVFDYINGRLFFSPQHYHSWEISGTSIKLISGNSLELEARHPNAFYWITNITTFH